MCKCRTDSAAYHYPDDVMTPAEEAAQELERECQIEAFINNWDVKTEGYYDALEEIICELNLELMALVSCAVKNGAISSVDIIREVKKEAVKYAETQIDNDNIWWDWS